MGKKMYSCPEQAKCIIDDYGDTIGKLVGLERTSYNYEKYLRNSSFDIKNSDFDDIFCKWTKKYKIEYSTFWALTVISKYYDVFDYFGIEYTPVLRENAEGEIKKYINKLCLELKYSFVDEWTVDLLFLIRGDKIYARIGDKLACPFELFLDDEYKYVGDINDFEVSVFQTFLSNNIVIVNSGELTDFFKWYIDWKDTDTPGSLRVIIGKNSIDSTKNEDYLVELKKIWEISNIDDIFVYQSDKQSLQKTCDTIINLIFDGKINTKNINKTGFLCYMLHLLGAVKNIESFKCYQ
jgi:hypothetical protein